MGQKAPYYQLDKLPPAREKVETIEILRQTNKSTAALAELKGIAKTIPNQEMLINAIVLQNIKIGANTRIGANSVVMRNTKDHYLYFGNPARKIKL